MTKTIKLTSLSIVTTLILAGCGSSDATASTDTTEESSSETKTGYFIDSAVSGVDYVTTSKLTGTTDNFGRFNYKEGDKVKLYIGKLLLGEVTPTSEGLITPKTLAKQSNDSIKSESLILRVLQSLDVDANASNGIDISSSTKNNFSSLKDEVEINSLEEKNLTQIPEIGNEIDHDNDGHIDVSKEEAEIHFNQSVETWDNGHRPDDDEKENSHIEETPSTTHVETEANSTQTHGNSINLNNYPTISLENKQKYALAYMWNEEKLAYDLYSELNKIQPLKQLENIANRAEIKHIQMVEDLIQKYDINITNLDTYEIKYSETELRALPIGKFGVEPIQELYNTLYDKGIKSTQDALEVGCMVEVTDINDLEEYISTAKEVNATDLVDTFDKLIVGSYNHYWSFDKGLKKIGVTEGCCSLGSIDGIEYCQPEYPKNEHDDDKGHSESSNESDNEHEEDDKNHSESESEIIKNNNEPRRGGNQNNSDKLK